MTFLGTPLTEIWWPLLVAPFAISPLLVLALHYWHLVLFAPFAALLSAAYASRSGRNPREALLGGFVASAVLLLPWACLFAKNLGWRYANGLIQLSLVFVLAVWGLFSIGITIVVGFLLVFAFFLSLITGGAFAGAAGASIFMAPLGMGVLLVNVLFWWRLRRVLSTQDYSGWLKGESYVPLPYLEPFLAAYFWSVVTPLLLFGLAWITLTFTFGAV